MNLTAADGKVMTAEITQFANSIGLERVAPGRYSMLLVLGLFGGFKSNRLNPAKVIHEIKALESIGTPSQLKPPTKFKRPPLKGLWHKHYLEDGLKPVALNLKKGLDKYELPFFKQKENEAQLAGQERFVSKDDIKLIVDDAIYGNWMRLAADKAMTGEWIIYAQHERENYYLCLGTHEKSQHENLREQIDTICLQEFPFLSTVLVNVNELV